MTNDAALAEVALQQMQQSYQLALQGFEYKTNLQNNRLTYIQSINDSYFTKQNTLQNRLDDYTDKINSVKSAQEQAKLAAKTYSSGSGRSSSKSSSKSSSGGNYTFTETPTTTTTTTSKSNVNPLAGVGAGALAVAANTPTKTYSQSYNPKLSGSKASSWVSKNLSGKSFTASQLKSLVNDAYSQGLISTADKKAILSSYGVS